MQMAGRPFNSLKRHGDLDERPVKGRLEGRKMNENGICRYDHKTNPIFYHFVDGQKTKEFPQATFSQTLA